MNYESRQDGVLVMKIAVYTDDGDFYESLEMTLCQMGNMSEGNCDDSFQLVRLLNLKQMTEALSVSSLNMALIDLETPKGKEAAEFLYLNDSGCACYLMDKDGKWIVWLSGKSQRFSSEACGKRQASENCLRGSKTAAGGRISRN